MNLCYIEENFNHLDSLKEFVKDTTTLVAIKSSDELKPGDLLIVTKENINYEQLVKTSPSIIVWEELYNKLYNYSVNIYNENYDFYYLKNALNKAKESDVEAIAVGSSYSLFGVEESILNLKCVNLALASQDIYYACLIGRDVINKNNNIKKIFIGTGYYTLYSDLSLSKGRELMRITNVYYPIFRDMHNCKALPQNRNNILWDDKILDIEKIVNIFCRSFYEGFKCKYFTEKRNRFYLKVELRPTGNRRWFELDDNFQEICAYERTISHNKSIKYLDSYKENINILNSFVSFCNERNVKVYMITFPSTRFYKKYLLKEFRDSYLTALNSINGEFEFIDFNDLDMFDDRDFIDMDHLDECGAIKVSEYLNNL